MRSLFTALAAVFYFTGYAQFPSTETSSELFHQLEKFENTSTILYLAAHPDDENTKLISYFENHLHSRVAYLSLTRGDGGQNLIGTEIGDAIGILRTQELLKARSIDGGEQFFTRAVDFGYSKSAEESFKKWGEDAVLSDAVWVIRKFRPDVIVTRFPPTNYAGHGHHQASAIIAEEAFDLAADPKAFPEQLEYVEPWQPKRLYFNSSTWWNKDLAQKAKDSDDYITVNVGSINPLLGISYSQIAAMSRSQHRSQGFGTDFQYGDQVEYLQYVKGNKADPDSGILAGIEIDWRRLNAPDIADDIDEIKNNFNFRNPSLSAPDLLELKQRLNKLPKSDLLEYKKSELDQLILDCIGLDMELNSKVGFSTPGEKILARLDIVNTSDFPLELEAVDCGSLQFDTKQTVVGNALFSEEIEFAIPADAALSNPYWLNEPYDALYSVSEYTLLGKPENEPALLCSLKFKRDNIEISAQIPVKHKEVDPADAVIFNPFYIVPNLSFTFDEKVLIAPDKNEKDVNATISNYGGDFEGEVELFLPNGWKSNPEKVALSIPGGGDVLVSFGVSRDEKAINGKAKFKIRNQSDDAVAYEVQEIDYRHIPKQVIIREAELSLVPVPLKRGGIKKIGYIEGPGDDVAKYLGAAGYDVTILSENNLKSLNDLKQFQTIITGIRAFNTRDELGYANDILNRYVEQGGTWIVQYNTSRGLKTDKIGPYPFEITRERVTNENAEARFLNPNHTVLNFPNKLSPIDFDNWVQERGLYFAADWDAAFEPVISWNDPEEPPRNGGLIVAQHGKGHFVYTGISFFRELPAGVPGAYKLLSNIIAIGQKNGAE
ncbi:MAG: PIG-L family deacetylase [Cryomorphaceae bacterium]|nr:PIG-L family deacetylase [Flavobacteriales bacterium]